MRTTHRSIFLLENGTGIEIWRTGRKLTFLSSLGFGVSVWQIFWLDNIVDVGKLVSSSVVFFVELGVVFADVDGFFDSSFPVIVFAFNNFYVHVFVLVGFGGDMG